MSLRTISVEDMGEGWVFKKNGKIFVRSGAGIVADSVPVNEYRECINKAKAVMDAVEKGQHIQ